MCARRRRPGLTPRRTLSRLGCLWLLLGLPYAVPAPAVLIGFHQVASSGVNAASILQNGKARLVPTKPGSGADGNAGSVDLEARLSAAETGNSCVAPAPSAAASANLPYLHFSWGGAASYDQNPSARVSFGPARDAAEMIYYRADY